MAKKEEEEKVRQANEPSAGRRHAAAFSPASAP